MTGKDLTTRTPDGLAFALCQRFNDEIIPSPKIPSENNREGSIATTCYETLPGILKCTRTPQENGRLIALIDTVTKNS